MKKVKELDERQERYKMEDSFILHSKIGKGYLYIYGELSFLYQIHHQKTVLIRVNASTRLRFYAKKNIYIIGGS